MNDDILYPIAFSISLNREIDIDELTKETCNNTDYTCIFCKGIMLAIFPKDKASHFRHYDPAKQSLCVKLYKERIKEKNEQRKYNSNQISQKKNSKPLKFEDKVIIEKFNALTNEQQKYILNKINMSTIYDVIYALSFEKEIIRNTINAL